MARDMDFVRELLLKIDAGERAFETISSETAEILGVSSEGFSTAGHTEKLRQHLRMLVDSGYIDIEFQSAGGYVQVRDLTWAGYDFLDSIRDPEVWKRAKDGASTVGGWTVDLLKDMAKAYLKLKAKERLGLDL